MLSALRSKLTPQQFRDRAEGFQQLRRFIYKAAAAGGISAPVQKSFPPGVPIRVDLEIITGEICIHKRATTTGKSQ